MSEKVQFAGKVSEESIVQPPEFEESIKSIELIMPPYKCLTFLEAGVRAGMQEMRRCQDFLNLVNDNHSATRLNETISTFQAFLDQIAEVREANIEELQAFAFERQQFMQAHASYGVQTVPDRASSDDLGSPDSDDEDYE